MRDSGAQTQPGNLQIAIERFASSPLTVKLALTGELDMREGPQFHQAITQAESSSPERIVVDMRGLSFIDSTGLRLMLEAHERAKATGHDLVLIPGSTKVQRPFEVTKLSTILPFADPQEIHEPES